MFNRPALYFIFSPSRTHPSSFFSLFPPPYTHTLPKHSFIPLDFLSLRERDGPELCHPAHLAWNILTQGAVEEWRRESCCDSLLNVSESAEWQPFELKHFNDAFILPGRGSSGKKNEKEKSCHVQELRQILLWCHQGRCILSLTALQWAELSFRPAGNEVSGYFSSGRSPPYRHSSGDYVASVSGRSAATSSKSFNFTPCSAASNPPIPQGPSVNPCKYPQPIPPKKTTLIRFLFSHIDSSSVSNFTSPHCQWLGVLLGEKRSCTLSRSHFLALCLSHPFFLCFFPTFLVRVCLMSSSCWVCLLTDRRLLACGLNVLLPQLNHSTDGDNYYNYTHSNTPISLNTLLSPSMLGKHSLVLCD